MDAQNEKKASDADQVRERWREQLTELSDVLVRSIRYLSCMVKYLKEN